MTCTGRFTADYPAFLQGWQDAINRAMRARERWLGPGSGAEPGPRAR